MCSCDEVCTQQEGHEDRHGHRHQEQGEKWRHFVTYEYITTHITHRYFSMQEFIPKMRFEVLQELDYQEDGADIQRE